MTHEVIFHGQKQYPNVPLTGNINVDITLVEHKTVKSNVTAQYIEIICMNTTTNKESNRLYISTKVICDIINKEELDKNAAAKTEFLPLSSASMKSILIQKFLDLLTVKNGANISGKGPVPAGSDEHSLNIDLLLLNNVQLCLSGLPDGVTAYKLVVRYVTLYLTSSLSLTLCLSHSVSLSVSLPPSLTLSPLESTSLNILLTPARIHPHDCLNLPVESRGLIRAGASTLFIMLPALVR